MNNMEDCEFDGETEFLESAMDILEDGSESKEITERNKRPSPPKVLTKKAKMTKEWQDDDTYKLIGLVETQKCLWDASDEAYHNKSVRDCAWRIINEHFKGKYCVADLSVKWTNLRIQFRGYAARVKTKSGQGVVEAPKWRFYNAMSFVGRAEDKQTQQTVSNIVLSVDEENDCSSKSGTDTPSKLRKVAIGPTQSAATQIAETMREAVNAMKQRKESPVEPNNAFGNFLVSELSAVNSEIAAVVRKRTTIFFLQCLEDERKKYCNVTD